MKFEIETVFSSKPDKNAIVLEAFAKKTATLDESLKCRNQASIDFSKGLISLFKCKAKDHNDSFTNRTSTYQLKKEFKKGVNYFCADTFPGKTRAIVALAFVNKFLRGLESKSKNIAAIELDCFAKKTPSGPSVDDFSLAASELQCIGAFDFSGVDDLYLDDVEESKTWFEI